MPVKGKGESLLVGQGLGQPGPDVKGALRQAKAARYDFVALPLAAPGGQGCGVDFRPSVVDLSLDGPTWSSSVVGAVSSGLDLDSLALDAPPSAAEERRAALETELRYASHLGLRGVLLPPPSSERCAGYARAVAEMLLQGLGDGEGDCGSLALRVPPTTAGWLAWNLFRTLCDHHPRLHVALEFAPGASAKLSDLEVARWRAEPVRFVVVQHGAYVLNKNGYPVLPKALKALLLSLFRNEVEVILQQPDGAGTSAEATGDAAAAAVAAAAEASAGAAANDTSAARLNYVAQLFQSLPPLTQAESFAKSHRDTLQAPLQPLKDNLESNVYELFEMDPVKYRQYEEAAFAFFQDRLAAGRAQPYNVMVLGAGRGPLVARALRAAKRAGVTVAVTAVEKNPNAVHTLRHRRATEPDWHCVEVVATDMRAWKSPPKKADVVISELLGSFGDNELSPECLDGANELLAEDGVSIPRAYTSSLTPVTAADVWADARGRGGGEQVLANLETGYVVQLHRAFYPCGPAKDCFTYEHPNRAWATNDRRAELEFRAEGDALIHGFAGYFDCELYGDVRCSIKPETFSEGMFSWFPFFLPLQTPVFLRKGDAIRTHWWRRHDSKRVWYEWCLTEPAPTPMQNPSGRSWAIDL